MEDADTIINVAAREKQTVVLKQREPDSFRKEMSSRARAGNAHSNPADLSPDVRAKDTVVVIKNKSQKSRSNVPRQSCRWLRVECAELHR